MSGEGASLAPFFGDMLPAAAAVPAKAAGLRELADQLYLAASGSIDPKTARLAANELAALASALEAGGAVVDGYAVVPLLADFTPTPAPVLAPDGEQ